jgi:hypothetical protein
VTDAPEIEVEGDPDGRLSDAAIDAWARLLLDGIEREADQ